LQAGTAGEVAGNGRTKGPEEKRAMAGYTEEHAKKGIDAVLPDIETWPNQYADYEITIEAPEFTSVCPKTGLPDFGMLVLRYVPDNACLELKSYKEYLLAYRNVGIFYENVVNRVLRDVVAACRPVKASLTGVFNARGGMNATVVAEYSRDEGCGE
jgi:7-cyano-7-deazaguanine reductase